jgi:ABC-2 type transport system ATP-binding protein
VDGLTKRYGGRVAVDRLTLDIPRGVVAGFIGPNGAGKTTTMAMLLGLVAPTAGTGAVARSAIRPVTWAALARWSRDRPCGPG